MSSHDAIGCAARCLAVFGRDRPRGIATCPRVLRFSNVKNGGVLDSKTCDRARIARDPRFDGAFYTGVRTTRIYCRPTCPVKPARSRNVVFFPTAAAAERAGFRPCLRCRPESAPGTPAWLGAAATSPRALEAYRCRVASVVAIFRREEPTMAKGTLIAAMNIGQAAEDEFQDWYDTEHLPERERVPGFLVCDRWIGVTDRKISVATYDLDNVKVLASPAYLAIGGANLSPWSKRARQSAWTSRLQPRFRDRLRLVLRRYVRGA